MSNTHDSGFIHFATALAAILKDGWPPRSRTTLSDQGEDGDNFKLEAFPDGHFQVTITRADGVLLHEVAFQRVELVGDATGRFETAIAWDKAHVSVIVNKAILGPYDSGGAPLQIPLDPRMLGPNSTESPLAVTLCQPWIEKRKKKFATFTPRPHRRQKTMCEQARDLLTSLKHLHAACYVLQAGAPSHFAGYLASELRALLYWDKRDSAYERNYNPLLLRMASKADLPLPVYGSKNQIDGGPPYSKLLNTYAGRLSATVAQDSPDQHLMDIQEWLDEDVIVFRNKLGGAIQSDRRLSVRKIIAETAHTLGAVHYDEDVAEPIAIMGQTLFGNLSVITKCLIETSLLSMALGNWVLTKLEKRKLIDLKEVNATGSF